MQSLASTSVRGIAWTMLRTLGQAGVGFFVGIYLARTLAVDDFGLMAIAMSFIGLSELVSGLGVEASLIQRQVLNERHFTAAFTVSLLMGGAFFAAFAMLAYPLARFFDQPGLVAILPVLGLGQWCATLGMTPRAMLRRDFAFKALARVELTAYLFGYAGLSVLLATAGYGVWSLVWGAFASSLIGTLLAVHRAAWLPRLSWQPAEMRELLHFGVQVTVKTVINYGGIASANFIIGKLLGAGSLGLYARADQLANIPLNKVAGTFSSVMFPIYANLQHDRPQVAKAYLGTVAAVSLLVVPPLAVCASAPEIVIVGLYGEKWAAAAPIFAALCLASMLSCVLFLAGALVEAMNEVMAEIRIQVVCLVIMLAGFWVACRYDVQTAAWVPVIASLYLYLAMSWLALRTLGTSWRAYLLAQAPAVGIASVLALLTWLLVPHYQAGLSGTWRLIWLIFVAAVLYIGALGLLPDRWLYGARGNLLARLRQRKAAA